METFRGRQLLEEGISPDTSEENSKESKLSALKNSLAGKIAKASVIVGGAVIGNLGDLPDAHAQARNTFSQSRNAVSDTIKVERVRVTVENIDEVISNVSLQTTRQEIFDIMKIISVLGDSVRYGKVRDLTYKLGDAMRANMKLLTSEQLEKGLSESGNTLPNGEVRVRLTLRGKQFLTFKLTPTKIKKTQAVRKTKTQGELKEFRFTGNPTVQEMWGTISGFPGAEVDRVISRMSGEKESPYNVTTVMGYFIRRLNEKHDVYLVDTSVYENEIIRKLEFLIPDCHVELINRDTNPEFKITLRTDKDAFVLVNEKRTKLTFAAQGYATPPKQIRDEMIPLDGKRIIISKK